MPRPMLGGARQAVALLMVAALHIGRGLRVLMDSDPPYSPESAVFHDMLSRDWHATAWLAVDGYWGPKTRPLRVQGAVR